MSLMIACLNNDAPVKLAAEELKSYILKMDPQADVALLTGQTYDPSRPDTLWLGLNEAFDALLPQVKERELDDGIYIDVTAGCGVVSGTNARSVLLAAYRLLSENGCAFLHPGEGGEIIPHKPVAKLCAKVCEAASSRHRGVCIEGAVSYEHVLNMIRLIPKLGMNAYFVQFFVPTTFFDRWYGHQENPLYAPHTLTREEVSGMRGSLVEEVRKRGLMYHDVGHGWTCEPFGVPGEGWEVAESTPESIRPLLAEVNGKREFWGGKALNTNLCYGNPEARNGITDAITEYCAAHPEVDYLHFWLADGKNNHCECPLCRDTAPADFYVSMLNDLDAKLTARGISTRIVFLIYVDLLWEPKVERIQNPDRFVLMFAPITRTYSSPFLPDKAFEGELAPYKRNQNVMPKSVAENVERLKRWQAGFSGDSFDFDYHFMWDHFKDLGYYQMADLLMQDMKNLSSIGLNGMISCQNQRVFFPTGLGMHAMAAGLWNRNADFEPLANWYFANAYGEGGAEVQAYLGQVSELIDPVYMRNEKQKVSPAQAEGYRKLAEVVDAFEPTIHAGIDAAQPGVKANWKSLLLHAGLIRRLAKTLELRASGEEEASLAAWEETAQYAREIEKDVHELFDVCLFVRTIGKKVLL